MSTDNGKRGGLIPFANGGFVTNIKTTDDGKRGGLIPSALSGSWLVVGQKTQPRREESAIFGRRKTPEKVWHGLPERLHTTNARAGTALQDTIYPPVPFCREIGFYFCRNDESNEILPKSRVLLCFPEQGYFPRFCFSNLTE